MLQVVDLRSGDGIDALARAQAAAEGVEGEQARIADLARSALASPSVVDAAASEHWREVYVGVPIGGSVLEGYVDLLYRSPDGLVVIDHKTDRVTDDDDLAAKLAAYRVQLAAYAVAVERATGEPVADARLVFCGRSGGAGGGGAGPPNGDGGGGGPGDRRAGRRRWLTSRACDWTPPRCGAPSPGGA